MLCDCYYCKNYCSQVKEAYPQVAEYFASYGIDIEKPLETSPLEPDENCILEYCCCQYIVMGSSPRAYHHRIGDVISRIVSSFPSIGLQEEYFVLELYPFYCQRSTETSRKRRKETCKAGAYQGS